jgi:hypothetical protein
VHAAEANLEHCNIWAEYRAVTELLGEAGPPSSFSVVEQRTDCGEKLNILTKLDASAKQSTVWGDFPAADRDARLGRHHPGDQGAERQGHLALGEFVAHPRSRE